MPYLEKPALAGTLYKAMAYLSLHLCQKLKHETGSS